MRGIQHFCCAAILAVACLAPSAFAQSASNCVTGGVYVGTFAVSLVQHVNDDSKKDKKTCRQDRRYDDCKPSVVAAEGGSAAAYFLLAGLVCMGGVVFRLRRQAEAQKSV